MYSKSTLWAHVDKDGRLVLPPEVVERFGLKPGASLRLDAENNDIRLHRPVTHLAKVYIEITNQCNLDCRTCMRLIWTESPGSMSAETFKRVISGLGEFSPPPSVFFGGLGEPLSHPGLVDWVAQAKATVGQVELVTNGTLLSGELSRGLIQAGLDVLWVSIDGSTPESYADVRLGAELPQVIENVARLRSMRPGFYFPRPTIGVSFVAMKRNINDLPDVISLGRRLGAKLFMVTNVLPYTAEMQSDMLYTHTLRNVTYLPSVWLPKLSLPLMDVDETSREALFRALNSGCNVELAGNNLGAINDVCTFIADGSVSIGWDGSVSPCPPLLHDHVSYLHGVERSSRKHVIGNLNDSSLQDLWMNEEYVAYRQRVRSFSFAPCTPCGGCELSQANEEDCFGIKHPACGGCLWAQGVIQCP